MTATDYQELGRLLLGWEDALLKGYEQVPYDAKAIPGNDHIGYVISAITSVREACARHTEEKGRLLNGQSGLSDHVADSADNKKKTAA